MIVSTVNGGVSITIPAPSFLRYATNGGGRILPSQMDEQIWRWTQAGIPESVAHRHVRAMAFGGCTTAEALGIIRDKDVKGTGIEIWHRMPDRYFRSAWRRKPEGGPFWIDMEEARKIQAANILAERNRILQAYEADAMLGHNYAAVMYGKAKDFDAASYGRVLNAAKSWQELKSMRPFDDV